MVLFRKGCSGHIEADTFSITIENTPTGTPVDKAVRFLQENYRLEIKLDQLAQVAGTSKFHFTRLFREETGMTSRNYLRNLRFNEAKRLLESSRLSISEICYTVGYADPTTFGRIFKEQTGATPTEYRKNCLRGGESYEV